MNNLPPHSPNLVPVAEGLMRIENGIPKLIGAQCSGCEAIYFPSVSSCRNPACVDKQVSDILLTERGTLISYTIQRYRPPALFRMDDWAPYAIGLVDLGAGLEVMGMLSRVALDEISIGMSLELICEQLYRDDAGQPVVTYKFAPASLGDAR